jgi:hypothetical protein
MSSVTKVSNGWRARWRTPDGKSRSKTFVRKIDAEKHLTGTDHAKLTGAYVDPGAGRITFRTYGEQWRAVQVHRPSTAVQLETNLRRHVYPTLGDRPIGAIRPSEVQAWVRSLAEVLEPSTVELVYRYVVAIFRAAAADRVISQNPAIGTRLPRAEPRRVEPLEAEVVQAIIDTVPDRYRALVVLAAGTGLRQGECFGLTLDRVDFLRRQITVDRQLVLLPGSGPSSGLRRRRRAIGSCRFPLSCSTLWPLTSPATRLVSMDSCLPITPVTRSAALGSRTCGVLQ